MAQIHYQRGTPGVLPATWLIRPDMASRAAALVAIHGLNRETEAMAELLAARADATGRTIVLPVFDGACWPRFQRAACAQRSDWALLGLLQVLRDAGRIGPAVPDLSGFSGGAQFAHRFAWLYPGRVGRLCLVAPGWWTFPDARGSYPYAIGGSEGGTTAFHMRANVARFLDRDIHVTVGALDVGQDKNLRQDPEVVAQQGTNRVTRARAWTAAAIRAARKANLRPRITFRLMEDCTHSFADCVANGRLDRTFVPDGAIDPERQIGSLQTQLVEVA